MAEIPGSVLVLARLQALIHRHDNRTSHRLSTIPAKLVFLESMGSFIGSERAVLNVSS
jgi:hypothetical protein